MRKLRLTFLSILALSSALSAQTAINLDGVDDYVQTSNPGIAGSGARTVEAWIKTTKDSDPSANGQSVIVDWGNTSGTGKRFTFNILWGNKLRIEVAGSGLNATTPVNDGNWHHVAVTYDNTSSPNTKLYLDGVLDASGNLGYVYTGTNENIKIGQRVDGTAKFEGSIDEVKIWNFAKSEEQISTMMYQSFCQIPSSLVAYYDFEEGVAGADNSSISTVIDHSNNAGNGTLQNLDLTTITSNYEEGIALSNGFDINRTLTLCAGDSLVVGSNVYHESGNYLDNLSSVLNGCDSIVSSDLTILEPITKTLDLTECIGFSVEVGTNTYSESGNYIDTLTSATGCDSVVTTYLNIYNHPILTTVNVGTTIVSNQNDADYQWLDCNNADAPISGENGQYMYANQNGSYSVIVDNGVCPADTSECVIIADVSIEEEMAEGIQLYPNPIISDLNISFDITWNNLTVAIVNVIGEVVYQTTINSAQPAKINLSHLDRGSYFVTFLNSDVSITKKFIKK